MRFEEAWEQYDFTESEIISIGWESGLFHSKVGIGMV